MTSSTPQLTVDPAHLIPVALDKNLVQNLLAGLYAGAKGKALKVVISTDGNYYITSRELRMVLEADGATLKQIRIHNEKQRAVVTAGDLDEMRLASLASDVVRELREKYSPVFHSLADNIVIFGRAYGAN